MKISWTTSLICTIYLLTYTIYPLGSSSSSLSASAEAYPSKYGDEHSSISGGKNDLIPPRREVYGNGRIIDITHKITSDLPKFGAEVVGQVLRLAFSMKNGSLFNMSELKLLTHTGTHVDAPGHFYDNYFDAGFDVDSLDLDVLNGINY